MPDCRFPVVRHFVPNRLHPAADIRVAAGKRRADLRGANVFFAIQAFLSTTFVAGLAFGQAGIEATAAGHARADVALLAVYVLLALLFSFVCSVAEAVLLSVTPSYIAGLKEKQPKKSALLKRLKQDDVDRSLAAILTLNTIAHTVGAIGAGAKASDVFGNAWVGMFSAVMTLMILFLSEIVPKTLGALFWRKLAGATANFVQILIYALYPLILVSERLTKLISRGEKPHVFTREEFIAMAGAGEQSGGIDESESRIIRNLFRFQSLTAGDIMTPRTVIVFLKEDMTAAVALEKNAESPFSRFPLCRESLDDVVGFVLKDDLLLRQARGQGDVPVGKLKKDLATVSEKTPLSKLLEFLLDHHRQLALVVGEFGETKGLVTLEDVVETLLGAEIMDELDKVEDMRMLARRQWAKRAAALGLRVDSGE